MGIDPGILFPFGNHVNSDGNLKAGGKGILKYLYPFGDNVDAAGNVKPRGGGKLAGGYYGPGGNSDGSGQGQAQQSPGVGPFQGHGTVDVPRPSQPTGEPAMGGDRTTTNQNGVQQTMRAMSSTSAPIDMQRSFNNLLTNNDLKGSAKGSGFMSTSLPTTEGSPDQNIGPVANGQEYANNLGRQGTRGVGPVADGQVYGNVLENAPNAGTKGIGPLADGAAYATAVAGKGKSPSRLDAALNDKDGINSYMSKFSSEDQNMARRRAFLDGEDSMKGLKAREALDGYVHAGGKYYAQDGEKATELEFGDNRKIARGESSAQDLLKSYTQSIQQSASETAAQQQDPPEAFKTDSGITASNPGASGFNLEANDFEMNNDDGGGFAAPKGYKAQSTYKDPAFPNPFAK